MSHASAMHFEIEQLLYREARLLDQNRYEEWLEMLSDKIHYFAPVRSNVDGEELDQPQLLALFDDRKSDLAVRVKRIRTGHAHAEQPPSRTRRLISNVLLLEVGETWVHASSSFMLTVSRWEEGPKLYSGAREDRWAKRDERWLLERRRILFDLSTMGNLSVLL